MTRHADCARFETLAEQQLLEERPLDADEAAFLRTHPRQCTRCAPEAQLWERLAQVQRAHREEAQQPTAAGPAVERLLGRVQERKRSVRRQRLAWVVAPAAAAALLLGVLLLMQRTAPRASAPAAETPPDAPLLAHLGLVSGDVAQDGRPAVAGQRLRAGQRLKTREGLAVVTFTDATRVVLEPRSTLVLTRGRSAQVTLALERGTATFQVVPRAPERRFVVEAGWARVEVLGTLFEVSARPRNRRVGVARGRVRVVRPGRPDVVLAAGEELAFGGEPRPLSARGRQQLLSRQALASTLPSHGGAVLVVRSTPSPASLRLDGRRLGATPLSARVVPGDYALALSAAGHAPHREGLAVRQGQRLSVSRRLEPLRGQVGTARQRSDVDPRPTGARPRPTPPGNRRTSGSVTTPPPATDLASLLNQIRALRAAGQWRRAVQGYRRLRRLHPSAPEAHTSLVLMGQIQLRHLGQTSHALRSFEQYLRRGGSLAPEAAWGRIRALRALGRVASAHRACRAFVKRYPTSLYLPQVKKILRQSGGRQK